MLGLESARHIPFWNKSRDMMVDHLMIMMMRVTMIKFMLRAVFCLRNFSNAIICIVLEGLQLDFRMN